ncbi:hypothetical protein Tco_1310288 [Tanacetum coccineum]
MEGMRPPFILVQDLEAKERNLLSRELLLLWVIEEDVGDELIGRVWNPIYSVSNPWRPRNFVTKLRTGGGDVKRLGAKLEKLWCKVEVCGGVLWPYLSHG